MINLLSSLIRRFFVSQSTNRQTPDNVTGILRLCLVPLGTGVKLAFRIRDWLDCKLYDRRHGANPMLYAVMICCVKVIPSSTY